jgi:YVTN family beta-propeller protein
LAAERVRDIFAAMAARIRSALAVLCGAVAAIALGCSDGNDVGGDGALRVYVVNNGEPTLSVIDHARRAVIATIELGGIPHGQIPSRAGDRLYVATEDTREVIAVDTRTNEILWRTVAGSTEMHQPSLSADDRFLFAPDLFGGRVAVVDTAIGQVVQEVPMVDPENSAPLQGLHNSYLSPDGRHVFQTAIFSSSIARIDVASRAIDRIYELAGEPRPAAIARDQSKMYVQLSPLVGFVEVDLESGEETARIELPDDGRRPPGWDNWTHSHGIGLHPTAPEVWAASTVGGRWYVYSLPDLTELATIDVGALPNWIAFTPDGAYAYVTNSASAEPSGTVSVIDARRREVVATLAVGREPKRIHVARVPAG